MNDDQLRDLEQTLERVTAFDSPTDAAPHDDTETLRETWLSLASLLETTIQPEFVKPFEWRQPRTQLDRRLLTGVAVMAASLLLVSVALGWYWLGSGLTASPTAPANQMAVPSRIAEPAPKPTPSAVEQEQAVAKLDGNQLDWDDSLDQQLVSAGREMVRVQQDWHGLDNAFAPLQHGLEQMRQDIKNDQL